MKSVFSIAFIILNFVIFSIVKAQYCEGLRFTETPVFTESEIDSVKNVTYGNAVDWLGVAGDLKSNVYFPKFCVDTLGIRPFIMLLHGGGFLTKSKDELNFQCREFAKRGYVAATIAYRLGWNYQPRCGGDTVSLDNAMYRAMQDCDAALRYFVANASLFRIDTAFIFIGGQSSGAYTTVNLSFITQAEINIRFPWCQPLLGNLNASGNNFTNNFSIKGMFHNWGSIININYVQPQNTIPMVAFAGALDTISHIDSGFYKNCTNFPLDWGTLPIYDRIVSFGGCADLTVKKNGYHGVYDETPGQILFRIGRACCFFKSLFCQDCVNFYSTDSVPATCSKNIETQVSEIEIPSSIDIFPNPAKDRIMIDMSGATQESDVVIANPEGQSLINYQSHENKMIIDINDLPSGIYILRLINGKRVEVGKFIKQ
jgi:hypothetical protein